jgi:two-component system cell cycle sensor histidine kinase/response regulator CckA
MSNMRLRVLHIEDDEQDVALMARHLSRAGYDPTTRRVETAESMKAALESEEWDLVLSDYSMPNFHALAALQVLQATGLDTPFIIISGTVGEAAAVEVMRAGAHGYLNKDNLGLLVATIEREMQEAENRRARRRAEELLKVSAAELGVLFAALTDVVLVLDRDGRYLKIAPTSPSYLYRPSSELLGKTVHEVYSKEEADFFVDHIRRALDEGCMHRTDYSIVLEDGREVWFDCSASPMTPNSVVWIARDVTERKRAEKALIQSEARKAAILKSALDCIVTIDTEGKVIDINPAAEKTFGYTSAEAVGKSMSKLLIPPDFRQRHEQGLAKYLATGRSAILGKRIEVPAMRSDGSEIPVELTITAIGDLPRPTFTAFIRDLTERKQAEAEQARLNAQLESQRQRLINIVARVPGVVWEAWDQPDISTQRIDFVSDYAETMLGYSVEEWLSTPNFWMTIIHSDDRARAGRAVVATYVTGQSGPLEFRWVAKDGRAIWVETNYAVIKDERGHPIGLRGVTTDITERKRAERALRESEERYKGLIDSAFDGVVILQDRIIVSANRAYADMFGYSVEDLIGRDVLKLAPTDTGEFAESQIMRSESPYETVGLKKDGTLINIEISGKTCLFEDQPARLTAVRDTTERKRSEQELRKSEERYRVLVENAHDIIYEHDLEGNYTSSNKAGEHITGYNLEETLKLNIADTVAPEHLSTARQMLRRKLAGQSITAYELEIIAKNGRRIPVEVNTSLVLLDGIPIGVQGIARDVTERKQLEEQLRQSQKMEAIGQLAGGVAHDFNNLLTVIGGYSSILLGKLPQDSPHRASVEEIKKAGDRAGGLTRQLLAFSRKQILQPKVLDLNTVVSDLDKMLQRLISEDIDLLTVTDPSLGKVKADPGQIEQVLMNLAVNARDAMPDGGKLTIETANALLSKDDARLHGIPPGSYIMIAVSDTGCGMDAATRERIFEPFFTTKKAGKGTGLGLATLYGIVKQSGGHVWVYSEVGHGTTFKIYLPRAEAFIDTGELPGIKATPHGTETVLLVEDEDQVRAILRQILENQGYHVLSASHGEEALTISQAPGDIQLMITDVVMPQMSGRELAERVVAGRPSLRVLFMSGYTDDAIVRHGLLDEKLNFIQKPFDSATVARKVREVLDAPLNVEAPDRLPASV